MHRFPFSSEQKKYELNMGDKSYLCSVGKTGIRAEKNEGDGATPAGEFFLRKMYYRPDKFNREEIKTELEVQALLKDDGWCDDANSPEYNTFIKLPFSGSHEELWRADDIYDLIIVVGYNDDPVEKNKGSAIFIHIAREGYKPTAGCIALKKEDLLEILPSLTPDTSIKIAESGKIEFENIKCLERLEL